MTSRLTAGVFALTLAASTPATAQGHFTSDQAVREIARQPGTLSGKIGIVIVGALLATGHTGVRTARAWNVMGALLLVNIILIAVLSAPMLPWRVFRDGPANTWITTEPYIWLPTVMVAFAILGHIVIYRRVGAVRD